MMGVQIGDNNTLQGNINIGDNAMQVAKNFNQEFNSVEKILKLLKKDLDEHYHETDRDNVLKKYDELSNELVKPVNQRNKEVVQKNLRFLDKAFSLVSNVSSIAGLILTITSCI